MFQVELPENILIFFDNLCLYYVSFDVIAFVVFIFTWWYCTVSKWMGQGKCQGESITEGCREYEDTNKLIDKKTDTDDFTNDWRDEAIMNVKFMRHKALVKELKSRLTRDELEQEKKTEKMQLQKIFELLQEQEDKFQMSSMEQLEDQLHLYIN